jgi:hypothetical protein
METLTTTLSIILLLGLILVPILLFAAINKWYRLKFEFLTYLILGLITTAAITWVFAWWADYSNIILLKHYNGYVYNPDSGGYQVNYENVLPEDIQRVKTLEICIMGIGWPLKAIMTFVFYSPYLLIIYFIGQLIRRMKRKNKHTPNTML